MTGRAARLVVAGLAAVLPSAALADAGIEEVRDVVARWRNRMEIQDFEGCQWLYHPAFWWEGMENRDWMERQAAFFARPGAFSLDIFGLSVFMDGGCATVRLVLGMAGTPWTITNMKRPAFESGRR